MLFRWPFSLAKPFFLDIMEPAEDRNFFRQDLMSILSVDDDENDILLLQAALKAAGYSGAIEFAADGQEAIEFLDQTDTPGSLDLVLLDLNMPRRNGFECLQWMRSRTKYRSLPVAMFTTSSHPEEISKAYELGADLFLVKPLTYDELLLVAQALGDALEENDRSFSFLKSTSAFRPKP